MPFGKCQARQLAVNRRYAGSTQEIAQRTELAQSCDVPGETKVRYKQESTTDREYVPATFRERLRNVAGESALQNHHATSRDNTRRVLHLVVDKNTIIMHYNLRLNGITHYILGGP